MTVKCKIPYHDFYGKELCPQCFVRECPELFQEDNPFLKPIPKSQKQKKRRMKP